MFYVAPSRGGGQPWWYFKQPSSPSHPNRTAIIALYSNNNMGLSAMQKRVVRTIEQLCCHGICYTTATATTISIAPPPRCTTPKNGKNCHVQPQHHWSCQQCKNNGKKWQNNHSSQLLWSCCNGICSSTATATSFFITSTHCTTPKTLEHAQPYSEFFWLPGRHCPITFFVLDMAKKHAHI